MSIDFEGLAASLLARAESLLPSWLPEGKRVGRELTVGSLNGERGKSLSINLDTGIWKDFASGEGGGDLISLYAALNHMGQGDAVKALFGDEPAPVRLNGHTPRAPVVIEDPAEEAPDDAGQPGPHYRHGEPSAIWCYRTPSGKALGYVCRYESPEGKVFAQFRWLDGKWQAKSLPKPRPLYNLHKLANAGRVMVVEGEKAAEAYASLNFKGPATCWLGGSNAVKHVDWEPVRGRKIDLWPDNDLPGREAMGALAVLLSTKYDCTDIRIVNPEGQPEGWDVADAVADGWDMSRVREWLVRDSKRFLVQFKVSAPELAADGPPLPSGQPSLASPEPVVSAPVADLPRDIYSILPSDHARYTQGEIFQRLRLPAFEGSQPPCNESTVMHVLSQCPHMFWYDDFLGRSMTSLRGIEREFSSEADAVELLVWFQTACRMPKMREAQITRAIEYLMYHNRRNSAQEWLNSLTWDGIPRLEHMLHEAFGTEPDVYHQQVGRNFIMQMAHRILDPGCKADYVPIFEGAQGIKKTTMMEILGGDWFAALSADFSSKDFLQDLQGKMLLELPELANLTKSDAETVKAIISRRTDRFRKSYGRSSGDYPRMCVFAGTTNADDWNRDETGARRFWRVLCGKANPEWLVANREQLFAEATHRVQAGEQHWQVDDVRALELQQTAMLRDTWHEEVTGYCSGREYVRVEDILSNCLKIELGRQDRISAKRVVSILRVEHWVRGSVRDAGRVVSAYKRPSQYKVDTLNAIVDNGDTRGFEGF